MSCCVRNHHEQTSQWWFHTYKKEHGQTRDGAMATRDTIQELEDLIPTRGDHGARISTFHRLVGRTFCLEEIDKVKSKAHRSKKEKQPMPLFEKFVTEGREKADELAKDGAMFDGGEMAQTKVSTAQQKKTTGRSMRHCSTQLTFTVWWRHGTIAKSSSRNPRGK